MAGDYRDKASKRKAQLGVSIWFKLDTGDTEFRIAPTPAGKKSDPVWFERAIHRDVGAKKVSVTCGKHIDDDGELQGECYICDKQIPRLEAAGRETRAAALAPQTQLVIQVYRINSETGKWEGPFIWTPSQGLGNKLIGLLSSRKRDYADAKKGYNLTINRKGTGKNDTRYGEIEADTDPSAVPVEMLKKLKPFDQLVKELRPYSLSAQKAAIQGVDLIDEDVDDDLDDDDAPKAKAGKGKPVAVAKKKKPPVDEDEEEDESEEADEEVEEDDDSEAEDADEDEAEEEDEDEEPAPKSRGKKVAPAKAKAKKKPPVEEEEDEEADEDVDEDESAEDEEADEDVDEDEPEEEDEEPAPKKRAAAKKVAPAKAKAKAKKPPVEEEEDEEEEDIDLEDEDEEEVAVKLPPKKVAAAKKRK